MTRRNRPPEAINLAPFTFRGDEPQFQLKPAVESVHSELAPIDHFSPLGLGLDLHSVILRDGGADGAALQGRASGGAGRLPPTSNTGGKSSDAGTWATGGEPGARNVLFLMTDDGKVKELTLREGWGHDLAHVDQVSFTIHEETCHQYHHARCVSDFEFVMSMSAKLEEIFGFGVTGKRDKGLNFYDSTYTLGEKGYGHLSFGGQRESMLIQITGTGCTAAKEGWEARLYAFLKDEAVKPKLTRVDAAYDDLEGQYNVDLAYVDAQAGLFNCGGRNPFVEKRSDWDNPDGTGRTLYIGKRANGKYCRVYEKGKEQGCKASPWVRVEVEFKAVDRVIPFEILIDTGRYFAGAYPAFARLMDKKTPELIKIIEKTGEHAFDHYVHYASLQVGRLVNFMQEQLGWQAEDIVPLLARPGAGHPERLKYTNFDCTESRLTPIHRDSGVSFDMYGFTSPEVTAQGLRR